MRIQESALAELDCQLLPFAYGEPPVQGVARWVAEDFQVDEVANWEASGAGEHAVLRIRKRGLNTDWIARQLARIARVSIRCVSYAGMKDRHALTTQWFSVHLPGREEVDWSAIESEQIQLLEVRRHQRKLRKGALRGNRFQLRLREVQGDTELLQHRLRQIASGGMANYFGPQRFGHAGSNLDRAQDLFAGKLNGRERQRRGLYLSAARSALFNRVLAERIAHGNWDRALEGEVVVLEGTRRWFCAEEVDAALRARVTQMDVHPSGPLWGRGRLPSEAAAARLEQEALCGFEDWCRGLERFGLKQDRRALRIVVQDLVWRQWEGNLELCFFLPAGAYATSLLRECVRLKGS